MARKPSSGLPAKTPSIDEFRSRAWTYEVGLLKTGAYRASVVELEDCEAEGSTRAEALNNLEEALAEYLESAIARGEEIPQPLPLRHRTQSERLPKGRLTLRLPRWLHARIVRLARLEQVSVNQLISTALAAYAGEDDSSWRPLPANVPDAGAELRAVIGDNEKALEAAMKAIQTLEGVGATNLGLLLRALVTDRIQAVEGTYEASRHLGRSARKAADARHAHLAEAFWSESLRLVEENPHSRAAFGDFLFEQSRDEKLDEERHKQIIQLLKDAKSDWSRVQLHWCQWELAADRTTQQKTHDELVTALAEAAATYRGQAHRLTWVRYVRSLGKNKIISPQEIEKLVADAKWYLDRKDQTAAPLEIELSDVLPPKSRS